MNSPTPFKLDKSVMSAKYWELWNDNVQRAIDERIEKYRKADFTAGGFKPGEEIEVEQLSHEFFFGAHIFNYNQLGSVEANNAHKDIFGTLFNSATVAFYWKTLEPYPNQIRFEERYEDTEEYWNKAENPALVPHWRRPASDPVVAFCKERGLRIHGHPMIWGNNSWHYPVWIFDRYCPQHEKEALFGYAGIPRRDFRESLFGKNDKYNRDWHVACTELFSRADENEIAALAPEYIANMRRIFEKRIRDLAERYGDVIDSWDVVNESASDFDITGIAVSGLPVTKSGYGLMPGDYTYKAFKDAEKYLPAKARLNINDYSFRKSYTEQIRQLRAAGAKIDVLGSQMHIFNPTASTAMAAGENVNDQIPEKLDERFGWYNETGLPIHLSEITITAPGTDAKSEMIQAILVRNLYRYWFSVQNMNGITWWNTVDGCGAPGEPAISGILKRDGTPKAAYFEMNDLINREWKTRLTVKADENGVIRFRGFKGHYRLTRIIDGMKTTSSCGYTLSDSGTEMEKLGFPPAKVFPKTVNIDGKPFDVKDDGMIDLAKVYPDGAGKQGKTGTQVADISFTVNVPEECKRRFFFQNDWFGELSVNGTTCVKNLLGPCGGAFDSRVVQLKAGDNEIHFKSRAGSSGKWIVSLAIESQE